MQIKKVIFVFIYSMYVRMQACILYNMAQKSRFSRELEDLLFSIENTKYVDTDIYLSPSFLSFHKHCETAALVQKLIGIEEWAYC